MSTIFLLGIIQTELPSAADDSEAPLVTNIYKTGLAMYALQSFVVLITDKLKLIIKWREAKKVGCETKVNIKLVNLKARRIYLIVNRTAFCASLLIQIAVVGHYFDQVFNNNEANPLNTVICTDSTPELCF